MVLPAPQARTTRHPINIEPCIHIYYNYNIYIYIYLDTSREFRCFEGPSKRDQKCGWNTKEVVWHWRLAHLHKTSIYCKTDLKNLQSHQVCLTRGRCGPPPHSGGSPSSPAWCPSARACRHHTSLGSAQRRVHSGGVQCQTERVGVEADLGINAGDEPTQATQGILPHQLRNGRTPRGGEAPNSFQPAWCIKGFKKESSGILCYHSWSLIRCFKPL